MLRRTLVTLTTAAAALAVASPALAAPANDHLQSATALPSLSSFDAPIEYDTAGATLQQGEPTPYGSGRTVWFKWTAPADGGVFVDVCPIGSGNSVRAFRPTGPVSFANLVDAASGQESLPDASWCRDRFRAKKGVTYYVQVDGNGSKHDLVLEQGTTMPAPPAIDPAWPKTTGFSFKTLFKGSPDALKHECSVAGSPFKVCQPGDTMTAPKAGPTTFWVRAVDPYGNVAQAGHTWTVEMPLILMPIPQDGGAAPAPAPQATSPAVTTPVPPAVVPSTRANVPAPAPSCVASARLASKVKLATVRRKGVRFAGCKVTLKQRGRTLRSARQVRRGALQVLVTKGAERRTLKVKVA